MYLGFHIVAQLAWKARDEGADRPRVPGVSHATDPSQQSGRQRPTTTSSSRPFRTAQITSSCFVLTPSLSCIR